MVGDRRRVAFRWGEMGGRHHETRASRGSSPKTARGETSLLVQFGKSLKPGEKLEQRESLKTPEGEGIFAKNRFFLEEVAQRE